MYTTEEMEPDASSATTKLVRSIGYSLPAGRPRKVVPTENIQSRGSTTSNIPYPEVCQLSISNDNEALFATATCKVYITIGAVPKAMTSVKCLIDTGAGSNLANKFFLHLTCMNLT